MQCNGLSALPDVNTRFVFKNQCVLPNGFDFNMGYKRSVTGWNLVAAIGLVSFFLVVHLFCRAERAWSTRADFSTLPGRCDLAHSMTVRTYVLAPAFLLR